MSEEALQSGSTPIKVDQNVNGNITNPASVNGWLSWNTQPAAFPVIVAYVHEAYNPVRIYVRAQIGDTVPILNTSAQQTFVRSVLLPSTIQQWDGTTVSSSQTWTINYSPNSIDSNGNVNFVRARVLNMDVVIVSDGISATALNTVGSVIAANIPSITNLSTFEFDEISRQAVPSTCCTGQVQLGAGVSMSSVPNEAAPELMVTGQQCPSDQSGRSITTADGGELVQWTYTGNSWIGNGTLSWMSPYINISGVDTSYSTFAIPPEAIPTFIIDWTYGPTPNPGDSGNITWTHVYMTCVTQYNTVTNVTTHYYQTVTTTQLCIIPPYVAGTSPPLFPAFSTFPTCPMEIEAACLGTSNGGTWVGSFLQVSGASTGGGVLGVRFGTRCKRALWGPVRLAAVRSQAAQQELTITGTLTTEVEPSATIAPYCRIDKDDQYRVNVNKVPPPPRKRDRDGK
jgi:hypothetical protein